MSAARAHSASTPCAARSGWSTGSRLSPSERCVSLWQCPSYPRRAGCPPPDRRTPRRLSTPPSSTSNRDSPSAMMLTSKPLVSYSTSARVVWVPLRVCCHPPRPVAHAPPWSCKSRCSNAHASSATASAMVICMSVDLASAAELTVQLLGTTPPSAHAAGLSAGRRRCDMYSRSPIFFSRHTRSTPPGAAARTDRGTRTQRGCQNGQRNPWRSSRAARPPSVEVEPVVSQPQPRRNLPGAHLPEPPFTSLSPPMGTILSTTPSPLNASPYELADLSHPVLRTTRASPRAWEGRRQTVRFSGASRRARPLTSPPASPSPASRRRVRGRVRVVAATGDANPCRPRLPPLPSPSLRLLVAVDKLLLDVHRQIFLILLLELVQRGHLARKHRRSDRRALHPRRESSVPGQPRAAQRGPRFTLARGAAPADAPQPATSMECAASNAEDRRDASATALGTSGSSAKVSSGVGENDSGIASSHSEVSPRVWSPAVVGAGSPIRSRPGLQGGMLASSAASSAGVRKMMGGCRSSAGLGRRGRRRRATRTRARREVPRRAKSVPAAGCRRRRSSEGCALLADARRG